MADEWSESAPSEPVAVSAPRSAPAPTFIPRADLAPPGTAQAAVAQKFQVKVNKDFARVEKAKGKQERVALKAQTTQLKLQSKGARASLHLQKVAAKRQIAATKAEAALEKALARQEKDERDADLARRGLRRQWLTGRVVPVQKSKTGAKAHMRSRPTKSRFSWGGIGGKK